MSSSMECNKRILNHSIGSKDILSEENREGAIHRNSTRGLTLT